MSIQQLSCRRMEAMFTIVINKYKYAVAVRATELGKCRSDTALYAVKYTVSGGIIYSV